MEAFFQFSPKEKVETTLYICEFSKFVDEEILRNVFEVESLFKEDNEAFIFNEDIFI